MFLVLQFPFADMRNFLDDGGARLARPAWPSAAPGADFVRSSGLVRPRNRGGIREWAGEELYGDGARALRFPNYLRKVPFGNGGDAGSMTCLFRRFHSEGKVARFDVGLKFLRTEPRPATQTVVLPIIRQLLELKVSVPGSGGQDSTTAMVNAGDALARHYLLATTDHKRATRDRIQSWWFTCGSPALVVEHDSEMVLPPHTRQVMDIPEAGASLAHTFVQVGRQRCSVWFIRRHGGGNADAIRRLRIHLVRLHAERECLKCVILHVRQGNRFNLTRGSTTSKTVHWYLRDTVHLIQQRHYLGMDQGPMLQVARQALGVAFEGETASLQLLRRQVGVLVKSYVDKAQSTAAVINNIQGNVMNTTIQMGNVSVAGDFNVVTAANIQNSFNKAANSEASDELKAKLKELAVQVAELAKKLPEKSAERVSKDLDALTTEAVSAEPRKEWYELSAKGLLEAAKTVAEMAAPVTAAVKAVLALLVL